MAGETIEFLGCGDVDTFFREGRQYFNPDYVEKMAALSVYFNRVDTQSWVLNAGTEAKGFRFGRGFTDPCTPWRRVISERCNQNSCDKTVEIVPRPGNESYTYHLLKRNLQTEWICVEDLLYRLFPLEEIMQFERTNARISSLIHEEFSRANYIGGAGHKWAAVVDPTTGSYCDLAGDDMFFVEEFEGDNDEDGYNLCHIRVKLPVSELANIAMLNVPMLEDALISLQREDDAYRADLTEAAGRPLLDIIIPDSRTGRSIYRQQKEENGNWDSDAGFDKTLTDARIGVNRVIGDFAFGYDLNAPKFYADTAFNATLSTFNENDPDTWPRLVRVLPYKLGPAELGCSWVENPDYNNADFAISVGWVPKAMTKWMQPSAPTGYGDAQMETQNYAGEWEWRRPDWECNPDQKMGFFKAQFRQAMQIADPTIMHVFLHRLDQRRRGYKPCCDLKTYVEPTAPNCYVCPGVGQPQT